MQAILCPAPGGPETLVMGEAPRPAPAPGELLVRVRATALNRADLLQRAGHYPPPPGASPLLGLEMAGEVAGWGAGVNGWHQGDRVCALLPGGGYAEYVTVPEALALRLPPEMLFERAAALPEAFLTAYQALHLIAGVQAGEWVLLHAAASGVGTAAVQLAHRAGARVVGTASGAKHAALAPFGFEALVDYRAESFADKVMEVSDGHGADVIVDFIGAAYAADHVRLIALDGRWVVLATMGGGKVEGFDLRGFFARRGTLVMSTLRSRSIAYKAHLTRQFRQHAWPGFADGTLRPVIDSVFDWRDVQAAHRRMEARENVGKIVLTVA